MRTPKLFGVSVHMSDKKRSASKSTSAPSSFERYTETAVKLVRQITRPSSGSKIEGLTVFASSFVEVADESKSIMAAFGKASTRKVDGGAAQSSSDRIRARVKEKKPSLKTMWSQQQSIVNSGKPTKPDEDAAVEVSKKKDEPEAGSSGGDILSDDIDQEVLSQLPPPIQSEIRMTQGKREKAKPSGKKNGINGWLAQKPPASNPTVSSDNSGKISPTKKRQSKRYRSGLLERIAS